MKATSAVVIDRDVHLKEETINDLQEVCQMLGIGRLKYVTLTNAEGNQRTLNLIE